MVRGKPTYLWAAEVVLRKHKRPLRAHEIVSYAQEQGLFSGEMHSRTPQKSMQARLSLDILNKGEQSVFIRTAPGMFYLREFLADSALISLTEDTGLGTPTKPILYAAPRRAPLTATERVLAIPRSHYEQLHDFDDGGPSNPPNLRARNDAFQPQHGSASLAVVQGGRSSRASSRK